MSPEGNVPTWVFTALVIPAAIALSGAIIWLAKAFITHLETVNRICAEERREDRISFFRMLDEYKEALHNQTVIVSEHTSISKEQTRQITELRDVILEIKHLIDLWVKRQ